MQYDVENIIKQFDIIGDFMKAKPAGNGHINDTFAVYYSQAGTLLRYALQRINHEIFTNPAEMMNNILRVTSHVRSKLIEEGYSEVSRRVLTVVPTREGKSYYKDADGNYWRVFLFIENAVTYDTLESTDQAYQAARAFGNFQKQLADLPEPPLFEIIPDFHNGPKRYATFQQALKDDVCNRATKARREIDFLVEHGDILGVVPELIEQGKIPVRTTHNDTKINNVMLDKKTQEGICVIDLDTVMPGTILYDFGDIVRTTTSPADEDETDLSKVTMLMPRFEALLRGYLSTAGEFLNRYEIDNLVHAGKMITLIIGMRFLTDYLMGDTYYKIHRPEHNLDRCRTQFKLVQSIIEQEDEMLKLVKEVSSK